MTATANNALEKLRQGVSGRVDGLKSFGRLFRRMDDDGNRTIDLEELHKTCSEYGVALNKEEAQDLYKLFDKNGDGHIDFDEILLSLRSQMLSSSRRSLVETAFKRADKTGDGILSYEDLKSVYNAKADPKYKAGESTEAQVLAQFLKPFDDPKHPDGKVTLDEFINYYAGVSASVDDDAYFNLMIRNAWKI